MSDDGDDVEGSSLLGSSEEPKLTPRDPEMLRMRAATMGHISYAVSENE